MANEGVVADTSVVDPGTSNTGASGSTSQQTTTPQTPGAPGTPHPDAAKWDTERQGMLRDLQAERAKRQQSEQQFGLTKAELDREQKRVRALSGIDPADPQAEENAAIEARLAQLGYPKLSPEDLAAMKHWRESQAQYEETTRMMWRDKARVMTQAVESRIAKELGGELTPRQITNIRAAYIQAAEADPQFLARHEQGDLKLAEEFAAQFVEDWFEPARRKATQQQVNQFRRVPGGKERSAPGGAALPKIDVNDPKAVEDFLIAGRKDRGQSFGR